MYIMEFSNKLPNIKWNKIAQKVDFIVVNEGQ